MRGAAAAGAALLCARTAAAQDPPAGEKWVEYKSTDCGYDDTPQPWCDKSQTVDQCKALCLRTPGCGGFNYPHGVLKKRDCFYNKAASTVDLYILEPPLPTPAPTPAPPPKPMPWPMPSSAQNGSASATVVPSSGFFAGAGLPKTLTDAFARYAALVFPHDEKHAAIRARHAAAPAAAVTGLSVTISDTSEAHPGLDTNESYRLIVPASGTATIAAANVYGALRGLETFSQLVLYDFDTESYYVQGAPWTINDSPRFPWRGLMLDTSRHFQTLASIRKIIDSLPYAKINVLHWHMSDSQSFPMQSTTRPKLWEGAHSPQERYLQADIADIVEYARARAVRVVVEFDMPGHAGAWCKGYPEVCPSASCKEPLNVASNETFALITDLLGEMTGAGGKPALFPDEFIHLGGDEVNTKCWSNTASIASWLSKQGMSADDGYAYFVKRAAEIAISQGRRPIQWVEVFDHFGTKLDKRTIVHVWKDKSTLKSVVEKGYSALINNSPGSNSWYLDHLSIKWDAVYGNEPCDGITDAAQCGLVLGGQGEMWGETVDVSDLEQTVWPKLGAIAERLWSPRAAVDAALKSGEAHQRIEAFRCLLNRRGIRAAPVNNADARSAPPNPGSCFQQ